MQIGAFLFTSLSATPRKRLSSMLSMHEAEVMYRMGNNNGTSPVVELDGEERLTTQVIGTSTHRVVVEDERHNMIVLCKGSLDFCLHYMSIWKQGHELRPFHNLLLMRIVSALPGKTEYRMLERVL